MSGDGPPPPPPQPTEAGPSANPVVFNYPKGVLASGAAANAARELPSQDLLHDEAQPGTRITNSSSLVVDLQEIDLQEPPSVPANYLDSYQSGPGRPSDPRVPPLASDDVVDDEQAGDPEQPPTATSDKDQESKVRFSNRATMFFSLLGTAVGTGNVWRFARIVALNGGKEGAGFFLILWLLFLFIWAIPIIVLEYAAGRKGRRNLIKTFAYFCGDHFRWMGTFIVIVNIGICCYYSTLTGYCMFYFVRMLGWSLPQSDPEAQDIFNSFVDSYWQPALFNWIAILLGAVSLWKGVRSIELVNFVLVPGLLVVLVTCWIRSFFLNASRGLGYLFFPDPSVLSDPDTYLEALTQNAFDTSAGWGLLMNYATYMKSKHSVVGFSFLTPAVNNMVSLISAMTIFSATFGLVLDQSKEELLHTMQQSGIAGTGISFIWMPQLFASMDFGRPLAVIFFLGLSFAALSSYLSLLALPQKLMIESGITRNRALLYSTIFFMVFSTPSAISPGLMANQDNIWGTSLIVAGAFVCFLAWKTGVKYFRMTVINSIPEDRLGRWWDFIIKFVIPLEIIVLLVAWIVKSIIDESHAWYNPGDLDSLFNVLAWWGGAMGLSLAIQWYYFKKHPQRVDVAKSATTHSMSYARTPVHDE